MKPKIIAVVGPTAAGKSSLASEIAKKFSAKGGSASGGNGEILCVDSRTVYRGMDIGTAKDVVEREGKASPVAGLWPRGGKGLERGRGKDVYLSKLFNYSPPTEAFGGVLLKSYGGGIISKLRYFFFLIKFKIIKLLNSLIRKFSNSIILKEELPSLSPLPSPLDIIHHGIDLVEPNEEMNGALFKEYADKVIADMVSRGKLPVLVGGTGLWFDMIIDNLEMPEVEPDLVLRAELEKRSEDELFAEFLELDPVGAEVIDRKNKRRLIRAIEVCKKTSRPFSELRKKGEPKYEALWLGIDLPIPILNERIDRRVDEMIDQGLVDEVKNLTLKNPKGVYALSGIGYQEICQYLDGQISLPEAINKIKLNTKHYAKRQRTWFKKNKNIHWVTDVSMAEKLVSEWL